MCCRGCGNRLGCTASKPEKGRAMGIPQNKAELLLAIDTNFSKLFKALFFESAYSSRVHCVFITNLEEYIYLTV